MNWIDIEYKSDTDFCKYAAVMCFVCMVATIVGYYVINKPLTFSKTPVVSTHTTESQLKLEE
jgi:hypothetical protein